MLDDMKREDYSLERSKAKESIRKVAELYSSQFLIDGDKIRTII